MENRKNILIERPLQELESELNKELIELSKMKYLIIEKYKEDKGTGDVVPWLLDQHYTIQEDLNIIGIIMDNVVSIGTESGLMQAARRSGLIGMFVRLRERILKEIRAKLYDDGTSSI